MHYDCIERPLSGRMPRHLREEERGRVAPEALMSVYLRLPSTRREAAQVIKAIVFYGRSLLRAAAQLLPRAKPAARRRPAQRGGSQWQEEASRQPDLACTAHCGLLAVQEGNLVNLHYEALSANLFAA